MDEDRVIDVIESLYLALQRTEANLLNAIRNHPVRDLAETLAESTRAQIMARELLEDLPDEA